MSLSPRRLVAAVLAGVVGAASVVTGAAAAADAGGIEGHAFVSGVSDSSGITVRVYDASGASVATTTTGTAGQYVFSPLPRGRYRVCFDGTALRLPQAPIGLALKCFDDGTSLRDATPVRVGNAGNAYVAVTLYPAAILTGTVRDTSGNGLPGAKVTAGLYVLRTGADGTYRTRVGAGEGSFDVCVDGSGVTGPTSQVGYLDACWNDNDYFDVAAGETFTADVTLAPAAVISGHVTDQKGLPLAGVTVTGQGNRRWQQTVTGADGGYRFTNLASHDTYEIDYTADASTTGGGSATGYLSQCYGRKYPCPRVATVAGAERAGVDVKLRWAAGASGRVTDRHGNGIGGVYVDAGGRTTVSAADGTWSLAGLTPGPATACFRAIGRVAGPDPDGYGSSCWPDKPPYQGETFTLTGGRRTTGIDAHLVGYGGVAGRAVTLDGTPVPNVSVYLDGDTTNSGYASTGSDGRFRAGGLEPGSYRVCLTPLGDDVAPRCLDDHVQVSDNVTTTLADSVLQAAATIEGTVTDDSGQGLSDATVELEGQDVGYSDTSSTDGDGHYTFRGVPAGTYSVCFRASYAWPQDTSGRGRDDQCYREVWQDVNRWWTADGTTPVTAGIGQAVTGIDAQIHPRTQITGRVTDAVGRPVGNVQIMLDGGIVTSSSWSDGTYTIEAVSPGTHTLCFDGGSGHGAGGAAGYTSMCWRNQPMGSPKPLNVPAHQRVVVDARLSRLPAH